MTNVGDALIIFMMRKTYSVYSFFFLLILAGCSSRLNQSAFDLGMRMHGTYLCPRVLANTDASGKAITNETYAEADVGRIRCYQDRWRVNGSDLSLTRMLYQSEHCENPLGQVDYDKSPGTRGQCTLVKLNAGWLAEDKGTCLLKDLKPNTFAGINPLAKCSRNLPPQCLHPKAEMEIEASLAKETGVNEEITLKGAAGYRAVCKRYLQ